MFIKNQESPWQEKQLLQICIEFSVCIFRFFWCSYTTWVCANETWYL